MDANVEAVLTERELLIDRLRHAYRFSEAEALDFIDFCAVGIPVDSVHVEREAA